MNENPFKAPGDTPPADRQRRWNSIALGIVAGLVAAALGIGAIIFAIIIALSKIDMRENPKFWDDWHARQKAAQQGAARKPADDDR